MPSTKCDICPIRKGYDWLSEMCRLTVKEIPAIRPDLLTNAAQFRPHSLRMIAAKRHKRRVWLRNEFVPEKSMRSKYDKRFKKDTPLRAYQRQYKQKRAETTR